MSRPEITGDTLIYLQLMSNELGETGITGMIERAVIFCWKHFISNPKYRHYEAIAKRMISKTLKDGVSSLK